VPRHLSSFPFRSAGGSPAETPAVEFTAPTKAELEAQLGRKLKFKEKVGLWVMKKKFNRQARRAHKNRVDDRPFDGLALLSFLFGLASFAFFPSILAIIFGPILAIVFGAISLRRFKRNPQFRRGKGFAIAGLVLGIGWLAFWMGFFISWNGGL
jgi:hypothetical protein